MTLYGNMPLEEQTRAIQPLGHRKIVLATNVAETSLTIEGIKVVVDSGQARVMRFEPSVGLDRLSLEPISQASATQRAGRAGRVAPGVCYRLWTEAGQRSRPAFLEPEIRRVDLSGGDSPIDGMGTTRYRTVLMGHAAKDRICRLFDEASQTTGSRRWYKSDNRVREVMVRMPLHPRLARMVLKEHDFNN